MSSDAIIRSATDADLATITEIYAHYVRNTTSTFEIDPPDVAEIARRRADIRERRLPHLVAAVIEACALNGYRQMVAVIGGSDNAASIGLHASFGFVPAGLLRSVGFKFGRWLDSVLMQRVLGNGDETSAE